MKIYSILSHPNRDSLNGHLYDAANEHFLSRGFDVQTLDVYASESELIKASHEMYSGELNPNTGTTSNYLNNWAYNWNNDKKEKAVSNWATHEFDRVAQADLLYIQTPIWIYSLPGLLKIYLEQTFIYDKFVKLEKPWTPNEFAITNLLKNKKVLFGLTTGGSKKMVEHVMGGEGKLIAPIQSQFEFLGFEFLPPYVTWSTHRRFDMKHDFFITDFVEHLKTLSL